MSEENESFAVKVRCGIIWQWVDPTGELKDKPFRELHMRRKLAYEVASNYVDARVVRLTRRPRPKPVSREVWEGEPDAFGLPKCKMDIGLLAKNAIGRRCRLTWEVF